MEGRGLAAETAKPRGGAAIPSYDPSRQGGNAAMVTDATTYNPGADVTADAAGKPKKNKVTGLSGSPTRSLLSVRRWTAHVSGCLAIIS